MKERELRELAQCAACGKKIGELPLPIFWKVQAQRFGLDRGAVQQHAGLEQFFGGGQDGAALASIMGPDRDLAQSLGEPRTVMLCDNCIITHVPRLLAEDG